MFFFSLLIEHHTEVKIIVQIW